VDYVAKARPDGHTLVLASSGAMAILPHLQPNMPFDPLRDLSPITEVLAVPQIVSVGRARAEDARRAGGDGEGAAGAAGLRVGGIGSSLHLAGELFKLRAGIDLTHVPFRAPRLR